MYIIIPYTVLFTCIAPALSPTTEEANIKRQLIPGHETIGARKGVTERAAPIEGTKSRHSTERVGATAYRAKTSTKERKPRAKSGAHASNCL